ncbi:MAG: transketolase C-terminal domain-containing protein [Solirubrobacteraceae bacterium]|jgi:transketolase
MRNEFVDELIALADADPRVVLLTGDLGFGVLEAFAGRFPGRFYNMGVAEQNMIGVATGLAEAGFVPFAYSIATFASLRPYEFIRNGPALHDLPVRIVGTGGGFDYGYNGASHWALEDVAIMRAQPALAVIVPADARQARNALRESVAIPGPAYFRLGRTGDPVAGFDGRFRLGHIETLGDGADVAIIALGPMTHEAVAAAQLLADQGVAATVAVVGCVAPAPVEDLLALLARVPAAISVEAHYVTGGLGSLVAEVIAEAALDCRLVRRGVTVMPRGVAGTQGQLEARFGLIASDLAASAVATLAGAGISI